MNASQAKSRIDGPASNKSRSARQFPWTQEEAALLGKLTDREVAEKLNRTLGAVRDRRKFLGKTAVGHAPQPFRMEREPRDPYARLFGTKSEADQVLARKFGRLVSAVRLRRWKKRIRMKKEH